MIVAAVAATAAALAIAPGTTESFESATALPADWKLYEYVPDASKASLRRGRGADGKVFLRIQSEKANHARLLIPTKIEPGATYRFSAKVRAEGSGEVPAVLGVDGVLDSTKPVQGGGEWRQRVFYFKTGSSDTVLLNLSLGWFSNTVAGTADFDVVKLEKVDAPPAGASVAELPGADAGAGETAGGDDPQEADIPGPNKLTIPLAVLMALIAAGSAVVLKRGDRVG